MSAFDALMTGSRAAAVKEKKMEESMKRKALSNDSAVGPVCKKTMMVKAEAVKVEAEGFFDGGINHISSKETLLGSLSEDFDPNSAICWGAGEKGLTPKHIINVLAMAYCTTKAEIKRQYEELGDLGLVAQARHSSQTMIHSPHPLTVAKVLETFQRIAKESGKNSKEKKTGHVRALLVAARDCEPNCEELVIKTLCVDAAYEPGKAKWVKLKKDYLESMWDSLDLVPIGAYIWEGETYRFLWHILLACFDPDKEEFQTVTKAGTGFSEEVLKEHSKILSSKVIPKAKTYYQYVSSKTTPDVWFAPSEVWDVKAGGLAISPVYCAETDRLGSNKVAEMYLRQSQANPHAPDDESIRS